MITTQPRTLVQLDAPTQQVLAAIRTPLSAQPDEAAAEAWLLHVRAEFLNAPG